MKFDHNIPLLQKVAIMKNDYYQRDAITMLMNNVNGKHLCATYC